MPAKPSPSVAAATTIDRSVDGLILAPIERSPWAALRELRRAMRELQRIGQDPRLAYVLALSPGGKIVPGRAPEAVLFVLAYRLSRPRGSLA